MLTLYVTSEVKKTYSSSLPETVLASVETLNQLKIRIVENSRGVVTAKIRGDWPDGIPVKLIFIMKDNEATQLGIRSGFIGLMNKEESAFLHARIGERLKKKDAHVRLFR